MSPRSILAVSDFSSQGNHALARAALLSAKHGADGKRPVLADCSRNPASPWGEESVVSANPRMDVRAAMSTYAFLAPPSSSCPISPA
jgi:hypothetical protein